MSTSTSKGVVFTVKGCYRSKPPFEARYICTLSRLIQLPKNQGKLGLDGQVKHVFIAALFNRLSIWYICYAFVNCSLRVEGTKATHER